MEIPSYIPLKISRQVLLKDRSINKHNFTEALENLERTIQYYLEDTDESFVSSNSSTFISYLEDAVGPIQISKPFAVRIREDSIRLFIDGKEIEP